VSYPVASVVTVPNSLPRALRPFRHREYRLLVASMGVSLFASGMWLVALVWQVIGLGGGPSELSVVASSTSVGMLLSVLVGGVAADRLPRRALLIVVESVRVAGAALVGGLAVGGLLQLWHLAVVAFALGAAEAFFYPAYTALLPTIVAPDELLAANGVEGALRPAAMQALGPALAGLVVGAFAPGVAPLGAAGLYVVALLALLCLRTLPVPAAPGGGSVLRDLGEGFRYLFRTGWLFATLAFATLYVCKHSVIPSAELSGGIPSDQGLGQPHEPAGGHRRVGGPLIVGRSQWTTVGLRWGRAFHGAGPARGSASVSGSVVSGLGRGSRAQAVRSWALTAQGRNRVSASAVGAVPPARAHSSR
jgi:MFS family permease